VGTAAYQASASPAGGDGARAGGPQEGAPEGEEAVEGEFKEV